MKKSAVVVFPGRGTYGKDELGYLLSPNLVGYLAVWGFNTSHPVMKKMLKIK